VALIIEWIEPRDNLEYVAGPIGPSLAAIAVDILPDLASSSALTEQISCDLASPRLPPRALNARD
jgi:hypothetical protein